MSFIPRFTYSHKLVNDLGVVEGARAVVNVLPLPPDTTLRLRHDALQRSTRCSTQIEGNPLDEIAVRQAVAQSDRTGTYAEQEVRNYWRALDRIEELAETSQMITEDLIQELHGIVIVRSRGRRRTRSRYRTTECPVVDTLTRTIDYAPPEPGDVPKLMRELAEWLTSSTAQALPALIRAGILTHRFISIHPFDDGNGRTGRLLSTAELWRSGYQMRGFFSFEEYFSADRDRYYQNLQMGLPINFYDGRHDPDLSPWLNYFVETLAQAAHELQARASTLYQGAVTSPVPWEELPRRQQQVLTRLMARVLNKSPEPFMIMPSDIESWFGISDRTARDWLKDWSNDGFIEPVVVASGTRIRSYTLVERWVAIFPST
jgi:Fic family protein